MYTVCMHVCMTYVCMYVWNDKMIKGENIHCVAMCLTTSSAPPQSLMKRIRKQFGRNVLIGVMIAGY